MGIDVTWLNQSQNIVLMSFESKWNWDDFHFAVDRGVQMNKGSGRERVYLMVDMLPCYHLPNGFVSQIRSRLTGIAGALQIVVIIAESRLIEALIHALQQSVPEANGLFYVVSNEDEALALINERILEAGT